MTGIRFQVLLFLLLVFGYCDLCAQSGLNFKVLDRQAGLSDNNVNSLIQDSTGYLWIGTTNGLNRFDGHSFTTFKHSFINDQSIAENYVANLSLGKNDKLWICHLYSVSSYDPVDRKFSSYLKGISPAVLHEDNDSIVWVGCKRKGLLRLNTITGQYEEISLLPFVSIGYDSIARLNYNSVNDIYEDAAGVLWLATHDGLYTYNKATRKLTPIRTSVIQVGKRRDDLFNKILPGNGGFWFASFSGGLVHYNQKTHAWRIFKYNSPHDFNNVVNDIIWKKEGEQIWLATYDKKLVEFDITETRFSFNEKLRDFPARFCQDRKHARLWCGTSRGVYQSDILTQDYENHELPRLQPLTEVVDIYSDSLLNKTFYATSYGDGLLVRGGGAADRRFACKIAPGQEKLNVVTDLLPISRDSMWVITRDYISLFDKRKERWIATPQPTNEGLKGTPFYHEIMKDSKGNFWVIGFVNGAVRIDRNFNMRYFKNIKGSNNCLSSNRIAGIAEDRLGRIWFATRDKGISIYDPVSDSIKTILQSPGGLPTNALEGIASTDDGTLWLVSYEAGLTEVHADHTKITFKVFADDNLSAPATQVMTIGNGVWLSGARGVVFYNSRKNSTKLFDDSGFEWQGQKIFNLIRDHNTVLIGRIRSYVSIRPAALLPDITSYPLVLNSATMSGKNLHPLLSSKNRRIELKYDENNLNLQFAAIDFANSPLLKYEYKLEGWDREWHTSDAFNRTVIYSNLKGGSYAFHLKVISADGHVAGERTLLFFEIVTPFWKKWWFYMTALALLFIYLYAIYYLRKKARLRQEEVRREFENQIAVTELTALRAQMNPHFIFNSLNAINRYIMKSEIKKASEFLTAFSRMMRRILENSTEQHVYMDKEIELLRLYLSIEALRFEKQFQYAIDVESGIYIEMIKIPAMIIQPYVENAIWHGILHKPDEGRIVIRFFNKDGALGCSVEDNGIGYRASQLMKSQVNTLSKSYGMQISSKRLSLLDQAAKVTITDLSDLGEDRTGTRVDIIFPSISLDE